MKSGGHALSVGTDNTRWSICIGDVYQFRNMLVLVITVVVLSATHADLIIYQDYDQGGDSTTMVKSGDAPSGWNDAVSSVCASGMTWKLYQNHGYGGIRISVAPGACMNFPRLFNNQMSSAKIYFIVQ